MIAVLGHIEVEPRAAERLRQLGMRLERATRAEPGCRHYAIGFDAQVAGRAWLSELWDDDGALQAHFETPHMKEFRADLAALPGLAFDATRYRVEASEVLVRRPRSDAA
ncbi:putative quinol monooxygenase [Variovorax sp. UC122_21]|uniref:putative quinol monooxygenase n=1 Tax=Variovorax sp. UC122_21 TaxID=3374554 RepID=UPI00375648B2